MMKLFCILLSIFGISAGMASPLRPFTNYKHSVELQTDTAQLWWTVDNTEEEITFELHVKTIGWIALGISPGRKFKR